MIATVESRAAQECNDRETGRAPNDSGRSALELANRTGGHSLHLERITHRYGPIVAVDDVSLAIEDGELVALLGPSGCGKTTLLRLIAGFMKPEVGRVLVDRQPVEHLPPNKRGIGIVFQSFALFPHMTVAQNIAYGLKARGTDRRETDQTVDRMLSLVQLAEMARRLPRELSGGQQQRVALARALAVQPKILLLDEPFGALDKNLRLDMQIEIKKIQRDFGITTILVTHDQEEALSMADRVAVLNRGRVEQFGTPTAIYDAPASLFVNTFVGTTNLLPGHVVDARDDAVLLRLECGADIEVTCGVDVSKGAPVVLSVRPERLQIGKKDGDVIAGVIRMAMPLGPSTVYEIELNDRTLVKVVELRVAGRSILPSGADVFLHLAAKDACSVFPQP